MLDNKWIKPIQTSKKALFRLYCFPYAGSGASIFKKWSGLFPKEIEVLAVQLPGREDRLLEEPYKNLSILINDLKENINLSKPVGFFGHSMGALIAYELTKVMSEQIKSPDILFLSGCPSPTKDENYKNKKIYESNEATLIEELRLLNGTPPELLETPELLKLYIPILRADFSICDTYVYQNNYSLDCPLSVFGGTNDPRVSYSDLLAWERMCSGSFNFKIFDGDHFFIKDNYRELVECIICDVLKIIKN